MAVITSSICSMVCLEYSTVMSAEVLYLPNFLYTEEGHTKIPVVLHPIIQKTSQSDTGLNAGIQVQVSYNKLCSDCAVCSEYVYSKAPLFHYCLLSFFIIPLCSLGKKNSCCYNGNHQDAG